MAKRNTRVMPYCLVCNWHAPYVEVHPLRAPEAHSFLVGFLMLMLRPCFRFPSSLSRGSLLLAVLGTGLIATGCGSSEPASETSPPAPTMQTPGDFDMEPESEGLAEIRRPDAGATQALLEQALRDTDDMTYDEVLRFLGTPDRRSQRTVENAFAPGQVDTVYTLAYAGMQTHVYVPGDTARSFLIQVELRDPFYTTPDELRVGMAPTDVRRTLGAPSRVESDVWVYERVGAAETDLRLQWQNDRLRVITYVFSFA